MTTHFRELAQAAAADGKVDAGEILALRRQGWGDGIIVREEAEALFALNNGLEERSEEWCDFFVEAIGEFVLNGTPPRLQCDDAEARWLIDKIDHDGVVDSVVELEAMVRIVERAENVPTILKNYVLEQVEKEVLTGTGPTRCGGKLSATHISAAEVKVLRRVIFSSGGYGPAAVSRFDAELLFRLKDATLQDANDESWADLFIDGISNHLRGFALDNAQLSHERKLELVREIEDNSVNFGRFFSRMAKSDASLSTRAQWLKEHLTGTDGPQNDYEQDASAGDEVTAQEQEWLNRAVNKDGQLDDLEKRLIRQLMEDGAL